MKTRAKFEHSNDGITWCEGSSSGGPPRFTRYTLEALPEPRRMEVRSSDWGGFYATTGSVLYGNGLRWKVTGYGSATGSSVVTMWLEEDV